MSNSTRFNCKSKTDIHFHFILNSFIISFYLQFSLHTEFTINLCAFLCLFLSGNWQADRRKVKLGAACKDSSGWAKAGHGWEWAGPHQDFWEKMKCQSIPWTGEAPPPVMSGWYAVVSSERQYTKSGEQAFRNRRIFLIKGSEYESFQLQGTWENILKSLPFFCKTTSEMF